MVDFYIFKKLFFIMLSHLIFCVFFSLLLDFPMCFTLDYLKHNNNPSLLRNVWSFPLPRRIMFRCLKLVSMLIIWPNRCSSFTTSPKRIWQCGQTHLPRAPHKLLSLSPALRLLSIVPYLCSGPVYVTPPQETSSDSLRGFPLSLSPSVLCSCLT